jgi:chromosome segregation ATPase
MGGNQSRQGHQVCSMDVDLTHLQIDGFIREQERLQLEQQRLQRELKTEKDRNAQLAQENRRLQDALAAAQQQCNGIRTEYMRYIEEHERAAPGGKLAVGYALASKQKSSAKFEVRDRCSQLMLDQQPSPLNMC